MKFRSNERSLRDTKLGKQAECEDRDWYFSKIVKTTEIRFKLRASLNCEKYLSYLRSSVELLPEGNQSQMV